MSSKEAKDADKMGGRFNFNSPEMAYLGPYKEEKHVQQGYCKLGEIPLGLDQQDAQTYISKSEVDEFHAEDNDLDEDD